MKLSRFLAGADWQALLFVALTGLAVFYLFRVDQDKKSAFKVIQFVSNPDGTGNSRSLAYVCSLLVSTWAMFYLTTHNRLEQWFFTAYIGVFVAAGVISQGIGAKERTAALNADRPLPEPVLPETTTTTATK